MEDLRYQCYKTTDQPNLWSRWYGNQTDAVKAKHDTVFEFLEARIEWSEPHFKNLKGRYKGLGEVTLKGNVAWRIFGFRQTSLGFREFIVVHIGYHKDKVYHPKNILDSACKRVKEVKYESSNAAPCNRPK